MKRWPELRMKTAVTPPRKGGRSRHFALRGRWAQVVGAPGHAMNSMSAEAGCEFVDANVLVYAFDPSAKSRQIAAAELLERLWRDGCGCLSVQVLQEFFVTITRKV